MNEMDYKEIVAGAIEKMLSLADQRDSLEIELEKMIQFVTASFNLLSEADKWEIDRKFQPMLDTLKRQDSSLVDVVRKVLQAAYPERLTVAEVRNRMRKISFDFSSYASNPLSSISTTLRRLAVAGEVKRKSVEGVATYQMRPMNTGLTIAQWAKKEE